MQPYYNIDQKLHQICQTLAKINRSYISAKPDDSHTNLYFDSFNSKILSRWISTEKGDFLCALNILYAQFEWINSHYSVQHIISIDGKTQDAIETEFTKLFADSGLDTTNFKNDMHYDIPNYPFKTEPYHSFNLEDCASWLHYRTLANNASTSILGTLQTQSDVRIWPHHFDTGIFTTTKNEIGIGFGLAMNDSLFNDAYIYFSVYKNNAPVKYGNLSELTAGKWYTSEQWNGAVLPLSFIEDKDHSEQKSIIEQFISESIDWTFKEN